MNVEGVRTLVDVLAASGVALGRCAHGAAPPSERGGGARQPAAAPGETLSAKVDRIKTKLEELAPDLSVMAAIREANALMELTPDGLSLPKQADRLLAVLG